MNPKWILETFVFWAVQQAVGNYSTHLPTMNKTIHIAFRWRRRHGHITDEIDCIHRRRVLKIDILHHEHGGFKIKRVILGPLEPDERSPLLSTSRDTGRRATVSTEEGGPAALGLRLDGRRYIRALCRMRREQRGHRRGATRTYGR